jgi:hypothetical protein
VPTFLCDRLSLGRTVVPLLRDVNVSPVWKRRDRRSRPNSSKNLSALHTLRRLSRKAVMARFGFLLSDQVRSSGASMSWMLIPRSSRSAFVTSALRLPAREAANIMTSWMRRTWTSASDEFFASPKKHALCVCPAYLGVLRTGTKLRFAVWQLRTSMLKPVHAAFGSGTTFDLSRSYSSSGDNSESIFRVIEGRRSMGVRRRRGQCQAE